MKIKLSKTNKYMMFRLVLYITLTMFAYTAAGAFLLYIAYELYHRYVFYPSDLLYILANIYSEYSFLFIALYLCAGLFVITLIFLRRPFLYLEELGLAAKNLYNNEDTSFALSSALKSYEVDLTNARMKMLRNERAAKDAEQRKNDLVVYLAHDLKTPLTSVIGYLTLLNDEKEISEELKNKYISISLAKAERLEDLINEFFEITRFNLTSITLEQNRINLSLMLEQLTYEFKPMLDEKGLDCNLSVPPNLYYVCDGDKLSRVFDNLLRNAVNYSFPNSIIEISVYNEEQDILIRFKNKGNTIPPEKLSRIFEQFYRLDSARTTKSGGAGLGLAIAKEIAELHGGSLTAESTDDTILFLLRLPMTP